MIESGFLFENKSFDLSHEGECNNHDSVLDLRISATLLRVVQS
jgi:hypothetical protein